MRLNAQLLDSAPVASAYCIAYSGGLDSTVLLHLAHAAGLPGLSAIHVHHGLQGSADDWAAHCTKQCAPLAVPLQVVCVEVDGEHPQGPEAAAREARYAALSERLPAEAVLVTAHHAGDQAETVLLRLLRGTGVEGLAAMRMTAARGDHTLWRPLLRTSREALLRYAQEHSLTWIEDPHNRDPRYARSWLRAQLMPVLQTRWPDAELQLGRAADHAADAAELLQGLAASRLKGLLADDASVSVAGLLACSGAERRLVLRYWLAQRQLPAPYAATLQQLERDVLPARVDATPLLQWPGGEFRRYRDRLYASAALPPLRADFEADWDGAQPLALPAGFGELHAPRQFATPLRVRFARGGERLHVAGSTHRHGLKSLAQQNGIAPWLRPRLPLAFAAGTLVSVAGRWNSAEAPALCWRAPDLPGLPLSWRASNS